LPARRRTRPHASRSFGRNGISSKQSRALDRIEPGAPPAHDLSGTSAPGRKAGAGSRRGETQLGPSARISAGVPPLLIWIKVPLVLRSILRV
jgi:hypothetical protein